MKNDKRQMENELIELAGRSVYQRGEVYQANGCVRGLSVEGGRVTAFVYGGRRYRVALSIEADLLNFECDCPEGERGRFCKHCVAVGLEYLDWAESTVMRELGGWLATLPADDLVGLVMGEALRNSGVRDRLVLRALRETGKAADLSRYGRLIEHAFQVAGSESGDGLAGEVLVDVESSLRNLIEAGYAEEAAELIEGAPVFFREMTGREELAGLLLRLHHESCRRCGIGGKRLAERLLRWGMSAAVDVVGKYEDLLGLDGIKEYDRLVRVEWERLRVMIDAGRRDQYSGYERVAEIVERWAEACNDADLAISVRSRRLNEAADYLDLARFCRRKGREEEAIEWARRGGEIFGAHEAVDLYEFLAAAYEGGGEWREALAVLLALFSARPSTDYYRRLGEAAEHAGEWDRWREHALASDRSVAVSILLSEGDLNAAVEARGSGASDDHIDPEVLLELAGRIAPTDPEKALDIYRRLVTSYAERKNGYSYEKLIGVLRRMGRLMKKRDCREEFLGYLKDLRRQYRRRHGLAKMLDRLLARHERRAPIAS